MRAQITGTRNGEYWPPIGQTLDVPDEEAESLARAGLADIVPERAVAKDEPPAERAVQPKAQITRGKAK